MVINSSIYVPLINETVSKISMIDCYDVCLNWQFQSNYEFVIPLIISFGLLFLSKIKNVKYKKLLETGSMALFIFSMIWFLILINGR